VAYEAIKATLPEAADWWPAQTDERGQRRKKKAAPKAAFLELAAALEWSGGGERPRPAVPVGKQAKADEP
jgi:hypothetical protein